ncbi:hypothetical protein KKB18_11495 [bacterium]|nr:hypothetical protein [bacterium]
MSPSRIIGQLIIRKKTGFLILIILVILGFSMELSIRILESTFSLNDKSRFYSPLGASLEVCPYYKPDSYLFWRFKENIKYTETSGVAVSINNLGLRGEDYLPENFQDHIKVLCLGDSCTFGAGIEYEMTYPFLIEKKLNEDSNQRKYKVINAGVPGYTSFQGLRFLEQNLDYLKVNVATLYFGNHEYCKTPVNEDLKQPFPPIAMILNFFNHSRIFVWLQRGIVYVQRKLFEREDTTEFLDLTTSKRIISKGIKVRSRIKLEDYKLILGKIIKLLQSRNITPIIILSPCENEDPVHFQYCRAAKKIAEDYKIQSIDIYSKLIENKSLYFKDNIHPTPKGHEIIAYDLYKVIKSELSSELVTLKNQDIEN